MYDRYRGWALNLAFLLAGAFVMGAEAVWVRLLALTLGSASLGVACVLSGIFAGLAVGSFAVDPLLVRVRRPERLFAGLQLAAALFVLVSPGLLVGLAAVVPVWLDRAGSGFATLPIALGLATLVLLPGTACMGATLAVVVEARRRGQPVSSGGATVGGFYAAHVLGGAVGVFGSAYVVMPTVGLMGAGCVLAGIGGLAAVSALASTRSATVVETPGGGFVDRPSGLITLRYALLLTLGLGGIGFQVLGVHVLSQVLSDTVFTFVHVAVAQLAGGAAGALAYARWAGKRRGRPDLSAMAGLLTVLVVALTLAGLLMAHAPGIVEALAPRGVGRVREALSELALALAVFFLPAALTGALCSHLLGGFMGRALGHANAVNLAGCAVAPLLAGVALLPHVPSAWVFRGIVALFVLALVAVTAALRRSVAMCAAVLLTGAALIGVSPASLSLAVPSRGYVALARREGSYGTVMVSERARGPAGAGAARSLQVNRFHMGGGFSFGERRMGLLPLLYAPDARRALFLGVGTGATLGAVADSSLQSVDAVEIVPEVVTMLGYFDAVNGRIREDKRVRIHVADARRFVSGATGTYDVVVADLFHPGRDGAGSLYAREHFDAVRRRLACGGLFVQWLPLYQLNEQSLGSIVRTFLDVFPEGGALLGLYSAERPILGLTGHVGTDGAPTRLAANPAAITGALAGRHRSGEVVGGMEDALCAYVLDAAGLAALAGGAQPNTDLRPTVLFCAPRTQGLTESELGRANLRRMLDIRRRFPPPALFDPSGVSVHVLPSIQRYARALDLYLESELLRTGPGDAVSQRRAVDLCLEAFETAPRFRPALGMLILAMEHEPQLSAAVLPRLRRADSADPLVRRACQKYSRVLDHEHRASDLQPEDGNGLHRRERQ